MPIFPTTPELYPPGWSLGLNQKKTSMEEIARLINDGTHTIHVSAHHIFNFNKDITELIKWCYAAHFIDAYPKEWQEIQATLALHKLKTS